ncbi:TetR/AcrR family transcriptional regulator [Nocardia harenae]|uniref:TetR/AcrR family transcriptional regulator n=1 Tax=Nocardia harenae TaxID=358707 RepID=UPI00082F30B2|nr:TetR/AcrR family transcriptional regulator [Nocardia harenae]
MSEAKDLGLRERARRAVQREIVGVAIELFLSQGYDGTTIEQIATAAGLSYRSFFRYFAGKDDLLVQATAATGEEIAATLRARPGAEAPWEALRHAFAPLVAQTARDEQARAMTRLMMNSPSLQASHQAKQASWRQAMAEALDARLGDIADRGERAMVADALAGAALACLHSAQLRWLDGDGERSLSELLDTAMGAVHPLS